MYLIADTINGITKSELLEDDSLDVMSKDLFFKNLSSLDDSEVLVVYLNENDPEDMKTFNMISREYGIN